MQCEVLGFFHLFLLLAVCMSTASWLPLFHFHGGCGHQKMAPTYLRVSMTCPISSLAASPTYQHTVKTSEQTLTATTFYAGFRFCSHDESTTMRRDTPLNVLVYTSKVRRKYSYSSRSEKGRGIK
jgi:hypothetical protein